jgi:uncharacterized protein Yka (UPF0111/DUF47 family)
MKSPIARWFKKSETDLMAALAAQAGKTVEAVEVLVHWADGDPGASKEILQHEHEADAARRHLIEQIRATFVSPINPEDLFDLSERLDVVVNGARDLVREAEVLGAGPDAYLSTLAQHLLSATVAVTTALPIVASQPDAAWTNAENAIAEVRAVHKAYRRAMKSLPNSGNALEIGARQELYRRASGIGDSIRRVANRVEYTVLKET